MRKLTSACALWLLAGGVAFAQAGDSGAPTGTSSPIGPLDNVYAGVDYDWMTLSVSDSAAVGGLPQGHYYGRLYDLRVGYRLLKDIGVEAHFGIDGGNDDSSGDFGFERYYGVFAVPTATVFNTFELALPVGYAWTGVKQRLPGQPERSSSLNSVAFGGNFELPLQVFKPAWPNVRLTSGGIVFVQRSNAEVYGFHVGVRYDFSR